MCEYCGCRQIGPLAELMDEHLALLDVAGRIVPRGRLTPSGRCAWCRRHRPGSS